VVVNSEEQYSVWPADATPPPGWRGIGYQATRAECLNHVREIWTDMRPLSLRRAMEMAAIQGNARG
jgi:MbtH protein